MAIAFDNASNSGDLSASTGTTFSHTCAGSNRFLAVGVSVKDITLADRTVASITYAGSNLTFSHANDNGSDLRTEWWYMVNPATGANNVVVSMGGTCNGLGIGAVSLTGVDQTSPINVTTGVTGNSGTPSRAITTTVDNCWILDVLANDQVASTIAADAGQVENWNITINANTRRAGGSYFGPKTPAGARTMKWITSPNLARNFAISVFSIVPATSVSTAIKDIIGCGVIPFAR